MKTVHLYTFLAFAGIFGFWKINALLLAKSPSEENIKLMKQTALVFQQDPRLMEAFNKKSGPPTESIFVNRSPASLSSNSNLNFDTDIFKPVGLDIQAFLQAELDRNSDGFIERAHDALHSQRVKDNPADYHAAMEQIIELGSRTHHPDIARLIQDEIDPKLLQGKELPLEEAAQLHQWKNRMQSGH